MIRLRPEQLEALDASAAARFRAAFRTHALRFWPDQCAALGDHGLDQRVEAGAATAAQHGITAECDVARFLDLYFVWGDAFPSGPGTPWALPILEDSTLDGPLKVHQLSVRTTLELQEAEARKG